MSSELETNIVAVEKVKEYGDTEKEVNWYNNVFFLSLKCVYLLILESLWRYQTLFQYIEQKRIHYNFNSVFYFSLLIEVLLTLDFIVKNSILQQQH